MIKVNNTFTYFFFSILTCVFVFSCSSYKIDDDKPNKLKLNEIIQKEILTSDSPYYKQILSIAIKWKNAVLNKDFNALVNLSPPEDRIWFRKELSNKYSETYRTLYDDKWNRQMGNRSVYDILKNAEKLEIIIEKRGFWERYGYSATILFFDKMKTKTEFPLKHKDWGLLRKEIFPLSIFKDEGVWYVYPYIIDEGEIG